MPRKLLKYSPPVNRFTYKVRWNYAFHGAYSNDVEGFVPPANSGSKNTTTRFYAKNYFTVTVDWGDGQIEQFRSIPYDSDYGSYAIFFRHYMTEIQDTNLNGPVKFGYETIPPHRYEDGDKTKLRTVTMTFSTNITYLNSEWHKYEECPIFEFPELVYIYLSDPGAYDLPFDTFSRVPNLIELRLANIALFNKTIPDSLWTMTNLEKLAINNLFRNGTGVEESGIRNVSKLKNLHTLEILGNSFAGYYIREFNDLPKLRNLNIAVSRSNMPDSIASSVNDTPVMTEVDHINPNLTNFVYNFYLANKTKWPYHMSGYGLENLTNIEGYCNPSITLAPLPEYWYEYRSGTGLDIRETLRTVARADEFVNLFYDFVTGWEQITMSQTAKDGKRNQWYNLGVSYRDSGNSPNASPSGLYIAPEGFILGQSNGTPQSPMEKIYVLEKNYKQRWNTFDKPTS